MAPHSSILAWKIPWTEEPGRLQFMGSLRVEHDWATSLSLFTFMHWRRKWQPTPVFLPGESQGMGAWWASIYGVTQSWTQLKRPGSSSSSKTISKFVFTGIITLALEEIANLNSLNFMHSLHFLPFSRNHLPPFRFIHDCYPAIGASYSPTLLRTIIFLYC